MNCINIKQEIETPERNIHFRLINKHNRKRQSTLKTYSGCQKNVAVPQRLFLQPLMPHFRYSEHYYGKRYVVVVKKCCGTATFFSTTPYAALPLFGTLLWKAV
jgi:hypothetical protein